MRVTVKGQVTIPLAVRRALGIQPGTEVAISVAGDHAEIRPIHDRPIGRGRRLVDALAGTADPGVTTAELMTMSRGDLDDDPGLA